MDRKPIFAQRLTVFTITFVISMCAAAASTAAPGKSVDAPPGARTVNVVDHAFGLTLPDPYRWMEGKNNAEFQAWLKAQGEYTRGKLDALPTLKTWQARLQNALGKMPINVDLQRVGGRMFFLQFAGKSKGILMVREADGRQRVLLDAASLGSDKGAASITEYAPSPDGRRIAVNIDRGGNEITRIQILDIASGKFLPDTVEPVWGEAAASWLPDGSGFTYTQMAPAKERAGADPMLDWRVRLHKLGTAADKDPVLLRAGAGGNPTFTMKDNEFPSIWITPGSDWALAEASGAHPEARLCVARLAAALKRAATWRCLAEYSDEIQGQAVRGNMLYLLSMHGSPNGRVLAIDLSRPDASLRNAHEVLATSADNVISGLVAARDALYVKRMHNGVDGILRIAYAGNKATSIAMPFAGTAYKFAANPVVNGLVFSLEGWTTPTVVYGYEPAKTALQDLRLGEKSPADYSALTSTETEAISADGTRVPLSIIHRKDVKLDGRNRAFVEGYGGYGISLHPTFSPIALEWAQAGGVYAIAHVRGGGEKGDAWHRAGQGANKYKGVEDFIACAQQLAKLGYTSPERTALFSASAGGVLVGGALVSAPDQMGAAIIHAGILNPVRLLHGINGANEIAEMGDPRTAEGMQVLAAMDPYQNIRARTAYPAVLLSVGLNDSRVSTWETGKFAAKLRTATTNGKPIWIRTDSAAGHFGESLDALAAEYADFFAFLDAQLPGR